MTITRCIDGGERFCHLYGVRFTSHSRIPPLSVFQSERLKADVGTLKVVKLSFVYYCCSPRRRYSIDDSPYTTDILLDAGAAGKTSIGPIVVIDGVSDASVRSDLLVTCPIYT